MLNQKTICIVALIIFCSVFMFPDRILALHIETITNGHGFVYKPVDKEALISIYNSFLVSQLNPDTQGILYYSRILKQRKVVMTAYSSTPDQTDSTPFITANGTQVHDGIVAANFLKFGTKIKIPQIFGDKIFVVEDRMNPRFSNRVDIWFPTRYEAKQFGVKYAEIAILY